MVSTPNDLLKEGQDLNGWRVEKWHMQIVPTEGDGYKNGKCYKNLLTAIAAGEKIGAWGTDAKTEEVLVITRDGKIGYAINLEQIGIEDEDEAINEIKQRIKSKISEAEQKVLGL